MNSDVSSSKEKTEVLTPKEKREQKKMEKLQQELEMVLFKLIYIIYIECFSGRREREVSTRSTRQREWEERSLSI